MLSFHLSVDPLSKRLTTITALISAVAFWLQFKRTERLNEASFIMNFNNHFISNDKMTLIEHHLELYYNHYEELINDKSSVDINKVSNINLGLSTSRNSDDCQSIINYLVYLEALAALVDRQVLHLDVIDDLFSYRFFLAVNNPVVQENELIPYSDYYQGIYRLSEYWVKDHEKRGIPIPMSAFKLTKENLANLNEQRPFARIEVSNPNSSDNKIEIARCIYQTDQYIYPEAFGDDIDLAEQSISRIIGMKNSLYDYKNIVIAKYNGEICGACVITDGSASWDTETIKKRIGNKLYSDEVREGFDYASEDYFSKIINVENNMIELVSCCVNDGFRRRGIAAKMIGFIVENNYDKRIRLVVLSDNTAAINLYKKHGFTECEVDVDGFAPDGLIKPKCTVMIREPKAIS